MSTTTVLPHEQELAGRNALKLHSESGLVYYDNGEGHGYKISLSRLLEFARNNNINLPNLEKLLRFTGDQMISLFNRQDWPDLVFTPESMVNLLAGAEKHYDQQRLRSMLSNKRYGENARRHRIEKNRRFYRMYFPTLPEITELQRAALYSCTDYTSGLLTPCNQLEGMAIMATEAGKARREELMEALRELHRNGYTSDPDKPGFLYVDDLYTQKLFRMHVLFRFESNSWRDDPEMQDLFIAYVWGKE